MLLKGVCHITNSWNTNISGSLWINRKFWWAQDCGSHEREAHVQRSLSLTISYLMERTWVSRQMEKIEPPLSPQSARTSGIQEHKCWEGIFLLVSPPLHTYRHSLPLLQDNFSAELKLLLRGRKILNKKKNPIRSRSASNNLNLRMICRFKHLVLGNIWMACWENKQRDMFLFENPPWNQEAANSQSTKPSFFLPCLLPACLSVSLFFSGKTDIGDLDLGVNALLELMGSNISPEFCLCLSCNTRPDNVSFLLSSLAWPSPCFKHSKSGLETGKRSKVSTKGEDTERQWKAGAAALLLQIPDLWHGNTEDQAPVHRGPSPCLVHVDHWVEIKSFHSHMLHSACFLQLVSLLVPLTAGHFSNLAEGWLCKQLCQHDWGGGRLLLAGQKYSTRESRRITNVLCSQKI